MSDDRIDAIVEEAVERHHERCIVLYEGGDIAEWRTDREEDFRDILRTALRKAQREGWIGAEDRLRVSTGGWVERPTTKRICADVIACRRRDLFPDGGRP